MHYKFEDGCMWEGGYWEVEINRRCNEFGGGVPCKHCHSECFDVRKRYDGSKYKVKQWICPRVVIATNEGGYNSTGVCLDCILEAENIIANKLIHRDG